MAEKNIPTVRLTEGPTVLTRDDDTSYAEVVLEVWGTPDNLVITFPGKDPVNFPVRNLTRSEKTGRLSFISSDTPYRIREFREDDGQWLSKYRTDLPIPALVALAETESPGADVSVVDDQSGPLETLEAFSSETSPFILGVLYTNSLGTWSRIEGDWVQTVPNDEELDGMILTPIDFNRAKEFLAFYDRNYVTLADAEEYEASDEDDE